ncbi:MAG TPA: hypothetical protein PKB06_11690, partial [Actinotalea sp.]|nr:hypothetical protein [Actinotalea sp.]
MGGAGDSEGGGGADRGAGRRSDPRLHGDEQGDAPHRRPSSPEQQQGFAAPLSLEDDALDGRGYVPDVVVAASYNAGWGAVWGKVGYD